MGSNERAAMAFNAMKAMGISDKRVKPVLKNLLRLYNRKWELIEDENYRVLIDAIFDQEMEDVDEEATKKHKEVELHEALPEPPSKKMCLRNRADQASSSTELLIVKREVEADDLPIPHKDRSAGHEPISSLLHDTKKLKPPTSPLTLPTTEASEPSQQYIQDSAEHNPISPQPCSRDNGKGPILSSQIYSEEIVQGKTQLRAYETECTSTQINHGEIVAPHSRSTSGVRLKEPKVEPGIILLPKEKLSDSRQNTSLIRPKGDTTDDYPPLEVPIATTDPENPKGAINADPLHKDVYLADGESNGQVNGVELSASIDKAVVISEGSQHSDIQMPTCLGDGSLNMQGPELVVSEKTFLDGLNRHLNQHADDNSTIERDDGETRFSNSQGLVAVPPQELTTDGMNPLHDVNDISKGLERVRISVVNEVNSVPYPPLFYYIRWNTVYQSAYLNFSLARIGDDDCCSGCFGDCLSSSIPCACARDTGGEYAYTLEGLVKEKFLDECISMNRDPPKDRHFYCKVCPKEGVSEPCKGHLVRKFIKECWSKCGCSTQCGNRVVQRGIKCNLQVFLTSEGKGWGVRTLEDLPKGTFVCEYVGEVLTNTELYERNLLSTGNEKHTYPVLLDADWGSEGVLKDEEALCLDATYYGNVARFINHRCFNANLFEIPVEVETPDHHYYHLAFFTTRKVEALEELTWDYGIDFEDKNHPVKAFRCCCKSKYCRDTKRPHRNTGR